MLLPRGHEVKKERALYFMGEQMHKESLLQTLWLIWKGDQFSQKKMMVQKSINRGIILIDRLITNVLAKVLQNVLQVIIQYVVNKWLDSRLKVVFLEDVIYTFRTNSNGINSSQKNKYKVKLWQGSKLNRCVCVHVTNLK